MFIKSAISYILIVSFLALACNATSQYYTRPSSSLRPMASALSSHGEVHQAVGIDAGLLPDQNDAEKTVRAIALEYFEHMVGIMGIDPIIADIIRRPEKTFKVKVEIMLDDDNTRYSSTAVRSRHSTARGPAKGGIRFTSKKITDKEVENAEGLGFNMTEKCAGMSLPMGGAKGEAEVDIERLKPNEIAREAKELIWQLMEQFEALGEEIDIPAPDQNTGKTIMAYMEEAYLAWRLIRRGTLKNKQASELILKDDDVMQALEFFRNDELRIRRKFTQDGRFVPDTKTPILDRAAELERQGYTIPELATFTDKPVNRGGAEGREEATGLGGYYAETAAIRHYAGVKIVPFAGRDGVEGLSHVLRGYGNVGSEYAKICYENGGRFFAIANLISAIKYVGPGDARGIDIKSLNRFIEEKRRQIYGAILTKVLAENPDVTEQEKNDLWELVQKRDVDLREYKQEGVVSLAEGEDIIDVEADILVEAATHCTLNALTAPRVKQQMILELGNSTTTIRADKILTKMGVKIIPDILANAGGVTVSMYEAKMNLTGVKWPLVLTYARLEERINQAMKTMFSISERYGLSNRDAYRTVALARIIDAVYARMWRSGDNRLNNISRPYSTWVSSIYTSPETDEELMMLMASDEPAMQIAIDNEAAHRHSRLMLIIQQMLSYFETPHIRDYPVKVCLIGGPRAYKMKLAEYIQDILANHYGIDTAYLHLDLPENIGILPKLLNGEVGDTRLLSGGRQKVHLKKGDILVAEGSLAIADATLESLPNKDACFPIAVDSLPCMKVSANADSADMRSIMVTNDDYTQLRELLVRCSQNPDRPDPYTALADSIRQKKEMMSHIYSTFRNRATVIFNTYDPFELLFIRNYAIPLLNEAQDTARRITAEAEKGSEEWRIAREVLSLTEHFIRLLKNTPDISSKRLVLPEMAGVKQILPQGSFEERFIPLGNTAPRRLLEPVRLQRALDACA